MRRLRVAVLGGGRSSEHEVSLASAASVRAGLEEAGHEVLPIQIGREDGIWRLGGEELVLSPGRGLAGAEVVFPALHGPWGEDGTVQGLLEILDVAYVGAGVFASALCIDKLHFKDLMAQHGLPQVHYAAVTLESWQTARDRVLGELGALGLPVFVKPARLGSSVGIARVQRASELEAAVEAALGHDARVIVEAAAGGLEVECSVLGNLDPEVSAPGEIVLTGGEGWYDYEAKYTPGGMELVVPARISAQAARRVGELAREAFLRSGCSGLARADFFVAGDEVLLNELNTMPGFTATSVYAALFAAEGLAYPQLLERLLVLALERRQATRRLRF